LHDCVWFESQGIPAVAILSSGFAEAALNQAESLGMPELRLVVVPHPIQNRTDDEMRELADSVYEDLLGALLS